MNHSVSPILAAIGALALGAGAMYYLDPEQGRRRRALISDKYNSATHHTRETLEAQRTRAADHAHGWLARARHTFSRAPVTDEQLNGRIRARLGRLVSYPHGIETQVSLGRVTLRGAVLSAEVNTLMSAIWSMRGVTGVDNQLSVHDEPGNVPGLQGKPREARRGRYRVQARNAASALAVLGGLGAGLGAVNAHGRARTGALSLATALLALGLGDNLRRAIRLRQSRPHGESGEARQLPRREPATVEEIAPASAGASPS